MSMTYYHFFRNRSFNLGLIITTNKDFTSSIEFFFDDNVAVPIHRFSYWLS